MAIVIQAFVLCATDDPAAAENAVFAALNSGVFESSSPILDFATGVEQALPVTTPYENGTFIYRVPSAAFLRTANPIERPF